MRKRALVALAMAIVLFGAWAGAAGAAAQAPAGATVGALLRVTAADSSSGRNDNLVEIALITFGAAAGAMAVLSLGYLLRVRLGLVKPPPPPSEQHGSH